MSENHQDDNYHGNGRLSGALGKSSAYGIAAVPLLLGGAMAMGSRNTPLKVIGATVAIAAAIAPVAGLIQGWHKADTAIKDHDALVSERDLYKNAVTNAVHQGLLKTEQTLSVSPA